MKKPEIRKDKDGYYVLYNCPWYTRTTMPLNPDSCQAIGCPWLGGYENEYYDGCYEAWRCFNFGGNKEAVIFQPLCNHPKLSDSSEEKSNEKARD